MRFLLFIAIVIGGFWAPVVADSTPVRVGVLTDGESAYWTEMGDALTVLAEERGIEVDFRIPDPATVEQQETLVRDMLASDLAALALCPINPETQTALLNESGAAVPLITVMRDAPESNRRLFIGRDEKEAGRLLAQAALRHTPAMPVMVFCKDPAAPEAQQRIDSMKEAFASSYTVLGGAQDDLGDRMLAWTNMQDVIRARPEIAAFIGFDAYHGPLLVRAVTEGNRARMVRIINFGATPESKAALEEGIVHALVVDDGEACAEIVLEWLVALARGDGSELPEDGIIAAPIRTIEAETSLGIEEMMDELQVQAPWISEVAPGTP